ARRSGIVKRCASTVWGGSARTCGTSTGTGASGPSRPTPALPTARHMANASATAPRRSWPGAVAEPPSISTIAPLITDIHHSLLAEEVECRGPALAVAEAGILHAAEGNLRFTAQGGDVDVEHPRLGLLGVSERGAEVIRVDRGR